MLQQKAELKTEELNLQLLIFSKRKKGVGNSDTLSFIKITRIAYPS